MVRTRRKTTEGHTEGISDDTFTGMGGSCSSESGVLLAGGMLAPRSATSPSSKSENSGTLRASRDSAKTSDDGKIKREESDNEEEASENDESEKQSEDEKSDKSDSEDEKSEKAESDQKSDDEKSKQFESDKDSDGDDESDKEKEDNYTKPVELEPESKEQKPATKEQPQKLKLSPSETLAAALKGKLNVDYPNLSRIVRIFTSSTCTDTQVERNTLMEKIYPKLKTFCTEKGYDFQVVDMRWGVRDEATDDHMTSELCMRELRECQNLSTGPNFITFLGQKYGYRPFPPKIKADVFEKILSATKAKDDKDLLNYWFGKDDNFVPPYYVLHSIRSKLPAYADEGNPEKKKQAQDKWWASFERMQVILREGVSACVSDPAEIHRYFCSVTEEEITNGLLNTPDAKQHCYCFKRVITDLAQNTASKNARRFMDISSGVDQEALSLLNELKNKKIPSKLQKDNIKTYEVKWTENGIDPVNSQEHRRYIDTLCDDFYRVLCEMIQQGISQNTTQSSASPLQLECMQHAVFAQKKVAAFYGREDLLDQIKRHVTKKPGSPLVLCGKPGSGKTSLLARSMQLLPSWLGGTDVIMVGRFLGMSTDSTCIRKLLISLCQQLATGCNKETGNLEQETFQNLRDHLVKWIEKCAAAKPLYIFLDSLNQLDDSYDGREMGWLPKKLPKKTCLIMSTIPDEACSVLPNLKEKFSNITYLEVPTLGNEDITKIVTSSLKGRDRQLQASQLTTVKSACEKCATPLFLKIAVDEAMRWESYTPPDEATLKTTVSDIINALFDRVEKYHGHILVTHALAYITCAKSGLSENEIEDIMSCDDDVLNDVYQYHMPPLRRLPPLLWVRIRADLKDYLTDRGAGGIQVITWYHRQFHQVATKRYLSDGAFRKKCHSDIADYFLGRWVKGVKKPYQDKKGVKSEADRIVSAQPLLMKDDASERRYNLRKLSELPYHLIKANKPGDLKKHVFCNLMFLYHKLQGLDFNSVLDDLTLAENEGMLDKELKAVREVLLRSRNVVTIDINQLPLQLCARLISAGCKRLPYIKELLLQCQDPPFRCLTTVQGFLKGSGGTLLQNLVGHEASVDVIGVSSNGTRVASAGTDYKVKIWDASSAKEILEINYDDVVANTPISLVFCKNNRHLACASVNEFAAWDLRGGDLLKSLSITESLPDHPAPIGRVPDLGWILILREVLFVLDETTWADLHTIKDLVPVVEEPHRQQRDFCAGVGKLAVFARGGLGQAMVVDLQKYVKDKSGVSKINLLDKGQKPDKFLVQMDLTESGRLACIIYEADKYMDNACHIKVFNINEGSLLKKFPGFDMGVTVGKEVLRVRDQDHVVLPLFVAAEGNSAIHDINLNTGAVRKVGSVISVCQFMMPLDAKRLLTISASITDVVDVIQVEDKADKKDEVKDPDDLVEDKMEKEVDLVKPVPGSKRYMLSGYAPSALQIWDAANMKMVREVKIVGYTGELAHMATTDLAVTLTDADKVVVFDMKTPKDLGAQKNGLLGEAVIVGKLAVADGKVLVANKKGLEIRDIIADKIETTIAVEGKAGLAQVKVDPTMSVAVGVISANREHSNVYMFDIKKQSRLADIKYKKQSFYIDGWQFSWDGKYIAGAISGEKTSSTIIEIRTGTKRSVPDHDGNSVTYMGFSKITNSVITGTNSGFFALYDVRSLEFVRAFKPPRLSMAGSMTISDSGRYMCCGGANNSEVYVYDLTNGQNVGNVTGDNMTRCHMFSWDEKFILCSADGVQGVLQLYIHQPQDGNSGQKEDSKQPPIFTAKEELLKQPAIYGTELLTEDFRPEEYRQAQK